METTWFWLASVVMAIYIVMDGFDFGAGGLHLWVARGEDRERERRQVLAAIGPFWDGNEVWLLIGGGVLFLAFPKVLASGLSGFYLAIMMLLWALILRGSAIELRSHVADRMWRSFWDAVFAVSSLGAPVLLGAALGNLLRGVPLDSDGWFALPLFDSFSPFEKLGVLDFYTVLTGVFALVAILHHGALFLAWKTDGAVGERSRGLARWLFLATAALWLVATFATSRVAPEVFAVVPSRPSALLATAVAIVGFGASAVARRRGRDLAAFLGSSVFLFGLLAATASAVYPTMIKSSSLASLSLTVANSAAASQSLRAGLAWWPVGFALAVGYLTMLLRLHRGKASAAADGEGY